MAKKTKEPEENKPWIRGRHNQSVDNKSKRRAPRRKTTRSKPKKSKAEITEAVIKPRTVVLLGILILLLLWIPITSYSCTTQKPDEDCQQLDTFSAIVNEEAPLAFRLSPFVSESAVEEALLNSGRVDSVNVQKTWYNTLKVDLVERSIFAVWRTTTGDSPKLALDRNGVVITEATNYTADEIAETLDVRDDIALSPQPGDGLVETSVITAGLALKSEDLVSGYDLYFLSIDDSSREFEAIYRNKKDSDKRLTILFTTARPLDEQLIDANLSIDHLEEQGTSFKFIDVRLESSTAYR